MPSSHCMIFKVIRSPLFSHCMTIWGSIQSLLFSHCTIDRQQEVTLHDFTIGRIADNSVWSANYSQTHTRSDKVIAQDHADIMVYKSSPNTIINKDDLLTNILLLGIFIYKNLSSLLESETNVLCIL